MKAIRRIQVTPRASKPPRRLSLVAWRQEGGVFSPKQRDQGKPEPGLISFTAGGTYSMGGSRPLGRVGEPIRSVHVPVRRLARLRTGSGPPMGGLFRARKERARWALLGRARTSVHPGVEAGQVQGLTEFSKWGSRRGPPGQPHRTPGRARPTRRRFGWGSGA